MPITKSAKKALKRDKARMEVNSLLRTKYRKAVRRVREKPTKDNLVRVYSMLDRAAKKGVIHKNKAARLKSRLSKLLKGKKTGKGKKK